MTLAGVVMALLVVTLEKNSQPVSTILERGERFPGHVSAKYDAGAVLVIHDSKQLRDFWQFVAKDDTPPPSFDFRSCRVVAVFAPRGSTSATLSISKVLLDEQKRSAQLQVRVHRSPQPSPGALEEPAYLIAVIRAPIQNAVTQFEISESPQKKSLYELLQIAECWRLALITTLGILLYWGVSLMFRIEEARWLIIRCRDLWKKRVTGSSQKC
ncbi:MAG: hypothetical protein N2Z21_11080 [Candidatus Sumerlaeaceae bacterium]|nr:hypothetical protein [Candidatus Sumerlaeaceae bacterium]